MSAPPWTFDTDAWYFPPAALAFAIVAAVTLGAGYAARTVRNAPEIARAPQRT